MLLPPEIEAKMVIPVLRALIVRELVKEHDFTQKKAAEALGITQAAVSNYIRGARGSIAKLENSEMVKDVVKSVVDAIVAGRDQLTVSKLFYEGVEKLRKSRAFCDYHKVIEPQIDVDSCDLCNM